MEGVGFGAGFFLEGEAVASRVCGRWIFMRPHSDRMEVFKREGLQKKTCLSFPITSRRNSMRRVHTGRRFLREGQAGRG